MENIFARKTNPFSAPENAPGGECADKPVCKVYRKAHGYQKQEL